MRRSKDSTFYYETIRIFEEAFGIRQLEKGIKEVKSKHDVSERDSDLICLENSARLVRS